MKRSQTLPLIYKLCTRLALAALAAAGIVRF